MVVFSLPPLMTTNLTTMLDRVSMSRGQKRGCAPDVVGEEGSRDAELAHALELVLPGRLAVLDDESVVRAVRRVVSKLGG